MRMRAYGAVTVLFIPLVDVSSEELGPTQFFPGSHATHRSHLYSGLAEGKCSKPMCTPLLARGSVLAFDFRTMHRGMPNTTATTSRPMLYVIYSKPWFRITEAEGGFPTDQPLGMPTPNPEESASVAEVPTTFAEGATIALTPGKGVVGVAHGPCLAPGGATTKGAREWAMDLGGHCEGQSYSPLLVTRRLQAERLARLGSISSSDVVCDLGCGDASLLCELVRLTGCSAIGCDVDADAIARGRARIDADALKRNDIRLTHALIEAFMDSVAFASVTCVFVFLVPQQLDKLTPQLSAFLWAQEGNRLLSQRYRVSGLEVHGSLQDYDQAADMGEVSLMDELGSRSCEYFSTSLGAAFLHKHQRSAQSIV